MELNTAIQMAEDTYIWTMARTARTNCSCSIKGIYKALIGSRTIVTYARARERSMNVNKHKLSHLCRHCVAGVRLFFNVAFITYFNLYGLLTVFILHVRGLFVVSR